jgi:hypothetical protein
MPGHRLIALAAARPGRTRKLAQACVRGGDGERVRPRPPRDGKGPRAGARHQAGRPGQPVILAVHELKRLARNAAELMVLPAQLQNAGIQLELLTGPLVGVYDPDGVGLMLFAVLVVAAQLDRDLASPPLSLPWRRSEHDSRRPAQLAKRRWLASAYPDHGWR